MRRFFNAVSCTFTLVLMSACCGPYYPTTTPLDSNFKPAAQTLDKLKWYVDAYGGSSLSTPLLVQPDDSFKFNLTTVNPDTFFNSAKNEVSGRSAGVFQSAEVTGGSLSASVDIAAMQQYSTALTAFRQSQATASQQSQLLNQAALVQYQAAVASAQSIEDPTRRSQALAAALTQLSQGLSSPPATAPVIPTPPALPPAPSVSNAASALLPGFTAPQGLFAAGTPAVSGQTRPALLLAAGDTATNAILSLLGDASKMSKFQGKRVLFGVSMVSVNPGWKTNDGYSADLQVWLSYLLTPARPAVRDAFLKKKADPTTDSPVEQAALEQLQACVAASLTTEPRFDINKPPAQLGPFAGKQFAPYLYNKADWADRHPLVAAVSPMADAQSLDLQSATRNRTDRALQIALALSYVGLGAQGSFFTDFAKQAQKDIQTRTDNVVVNTYSHGGLVGFRMNPSLEADPDNGGSARHLKPYSFPTLLIVGTDDDDLRPRVMVGPAGNGYECVLVEPMLRVLQTPQWIPNEDLCGRHVRDGDCLGRMLTEEERAGLNIEIGQQLEGRLKGLDDGVATFMRQKAALLGMVLNGSVYNVWLPVEYLQPVAPPQKPTADTTAPTEITLEVDDTGAVKTATVNMLIAGSNLDQVDLTKFDIAAGKSMLVGAPTTKLVGKAVLVTFAVNTDGAVVFKLPSKDGSTTVYSAPFLVHKPKDFVVTTTIDKTKTGVVSESVRYSPGTPPAVVKSQVEKDKVHYPGEHPQQKADVKVQVQAESDKK